MDVQRRKLINSLPPEWQSEVVTEQLELQKKIGSGTFSCVFKAKAGEKLFAAKIFRKDDVAIALREAKIIRKCRHRNIVQYTGLYMVPEGVIAKYRGCLCLGMELVQGGSLAKLITKQMKNPIAQLYSNTQALQWMVDIAEAVEFLHKQQPVVVHRDIKPENVLLKPEGDRVLAKLCDFGLYAELDDGRRAGLPPAPRSTFGGNSSVGSHPDVSGFLPSPSSRKPHLGTASTVTAASSQQSPYSMLSWDDSAAYVEVKIKDLSILKSPRVNFGSGPDPERDPVFTLTGQTGTCAYMAPEVYKRQPYNEKVDVFSFAILLYETFSRGLLVFTTEACNSMADVERYTQKVAGGYRPIRPPLIPDPIWILITDCWAQNPEQRPTMSTVLRRLKKLANLPDSLDPVDDDWQPKCGCMGGRCTIS